MLAISARRTVKMIESTFLWCGYVMRLRSLRGVLCADAVWLGISTADMNMLQQCCMGTRKRAPHPGRLSWHKRLVTQTAMSHWACATEDIPLLA
jgi:hypothetical protein